MSAPITSTVLCAEATKKRVLLATIVDAPIATTVSYAEGGALCGSTTALVDAPLASTVLFAEAANLRLLLTPREVFAAMAQHDKKHKSIVITFSLSLSLSPS